MADMELVTDEVVTPSTEDIDASKADLASLLETLTLLKQFQGQMNPEEGICRDEVKALMDTCQVGLDERYPLESFTQMRSPQNYQVVTESIVRRAGQIVVDFFKRLLELLRKGVAWLVRAVKALFAREQHVKETVAKTEAVMKANEAAETILKDTPPIDMQAEVEKGGLVAAHPQGGFEQGEGPQQDAAKIRTLVHTFQQTLSDYNGIYNGIASALLSEKEFLGQIKYLGLKLPELLYHVEKRLDAVVAAFREIDNKTSFVGHLNGLKAMALDPSWFHGKGGEIPELREAAKSESFGQYMAELEDLVRRLQAERPHEAADWRVAARVITNPDTGFSDPFVLLQKHLIVQAAELEERVTRLSAPLILESVFDRYPDVRDLYDEVIGQLSDEFFGILRFFDVATIVTETQTKLAMAIYNIEVTAYQLNLARAERTQDRAIIGQINEIQRGLRAKVSQWNKRIPTV